MTRIACLLALLLPVGCFAAVAPAITETAFYTEANAQLVKGHINLLKFQPLEEADVAMECESTQPPQALATPHAALAAIPDHMKVVVNFIVGTDGQVYSPFVLNDIGSTSLYRKIIEDVRHWQYRPAMCNGVPTDAEVKVQLTSR